MMLHTYETDVKLPPMYVKHTELEKVDKYNHLGVIMENNLSFKAQLSKTICSVNYKIWLLRHFREHIWTKIQHYCYLKLCYCLI